MQPCSHEGGNPIHGAISRLRATHQSIASLVTRSDVLHPVVEALPRELAVEHDVGCSDQFVEQLRIGAGPPPIRVPEGWLLIHHGVTGQLLPGVDHQPLVNYAAGAMIWLVTRETAIVFAAVGVVWSVVLLIGAGLMINLFTSLVESGYDGPLAVGPLLLPVRMSSGERLFVMWSGLKGAVPILLASFVVLGGVEDAQSVYGIVFVVVLMAPFCSTSTCSVPPSSPTATCRGSRPSSTPRAQPSARARTRTHRL